MGIVPDDKPGKLNFFNARIAAWTTNAVAMGSSAPTIADVSTKLDAANDKYAAQVAAASVAKAATEAADSAIAALSAAGADVIKQVRIKAATAGPSVYELAQIPGPVTPSPVNTLGEPTQFAVTLGNDGSPTTTWKCSSPRATGVVYQVWRKLPSDADYVYQGGTGEKKWTDMSIPAGTAQVNYKIQAVRSTAAGPWAVFTVSFGTSSGGAMTASVQAGPKIAA